MLTLWSEDCRICLDLQLFLSSATFEGCMPMHQQRNEDACDACASCVKHTEAAYIQGAHLHKGTFFVLYSRGLTYLLTSCIDAYISSNLCSESKQRPDTAVRNLAGCAVPTDAGKVTSLQAARLTKMGIPMKPNALMKFSPMSESAA